MDYAFVNETLSLAYQIVVGLNLSDVMNKLELITSIELDSSIKELSNRSMNLSHNIISLDEKISGTIHLIITILLLLIFCRINFIV